MSLPVYIQSSSYDCFFSMPYFGGGGGPARRLIVFLLSLITSESVKPRFRMW
jgi:hypothetical protein